MGEVDGDLVLVPGHDLPHAVLVGRVEVWERRALQHSLLFVDVATACIWNTGGVSQRKLLVRWVSAYSKPQFLAPFLQKGWRGGLRSKPLFFFFSLSSFSFFLHRIRSVPPHASGDLCHSAVRQSCRSLQVGWGSADGVRVGWGGVGGCTKPIKDGLCSKLNFHLVDVLTAGICSTELSV